MTQTLERFSVADEVLIPSTKEEQPVVMMEEFLSFDYAGNVYVRGQLETHPAVIGAAFKAYAEIKAARETFLRRN